MTRKHFETVATAMNELKPTNPNNDIPPRAFSAATLQWISVCKGLASAFESYSPKFDADRFLEACGVE